MGTDSDTAARHGYLFRARIAEACDSQNPYLFFAVEALVADRPLPLPDRLERLVGTPEERAAEVATILWWGSTNEALFKRVFRLDWWALWCDWGCGAATA